MAHNYYFIPILLNAMNSAEPYGALQEAFCEIQSLGKRPKYAAGYAQFERFIQWMVWECPALPTGHGYDGMITQEVLERVLEGSEALARRDRELHSQPGMRRQFLFLLRGLAERMPEAGRFSLTFTNNAIELGQILLDAGPAQATFSNVRPGSCSLAYSTGRVFWEEKLEPAALLVGRTEDRKPLRLAAADDFTQIRPSREWHLCGGRICIRAYPGIESGSLVVNLLE